mgnify:CR=1 FL=1
MTTPSYYAHGLRRMVGRSRDENHRAATPLELLFDLTFVAAFGIAGNELAHGIAEAHYGGAITGFLFAMFAIVWAWVNYSWFASAFDTDDWLYRVLTMVQMAGVIVLAIGLPRMFASIIEGAVVDNSIMVAGYVVMRVALIGQWLRAARGNPQYRVVAKSYALLVGIAQVAWVMVVILPLDLTGFLIAALIAGVLDIGAPIIAEEKGRRHGGMTPWNAHHIAERYGLLAIIALGETVLGTLAAARVLTDTEGWSISSIMVIGLGIVITFALWWSYFLIPSAHILAVRRSKAFPWGYGHFFVFTSIAAIGAGLHVIGYVYDEHYHVSTVVAIASIALPVLTYSLSLYLLHAWLVSAFAKNPVLQISALALPVVAIVMAMVGWPLWACLLLVTLSPVTVVVSFESGAWRTLDAQVDKAIRQATAVAATNKD